MESSPEALPVIEELPYNIEQNWSVSDDVAPKRIDADDFDVYSIQQQQEVLSSFGSAAKKRDFLTIEPAIALQGCEIALV